MNECTYTKYNGQLDSDSLRRLNVLLFDYAPVSFTSNCVCYIFVKQGHTIKVKFKNAVHSGSASGTLITEQTLSGVNADAKAAYVFNTTLIGNNRISDFLTITGDIYNITCITIEGAPLLEYLTTDKYGLKSLNYDSDLYAFGGISVDGLPAISNSNIRFLVLGKIGGTIIRIDNSYYDGVQYILGTYYASGASCAIEPPSSMFGNTTVKVLNIGFIGSILNAPKNIKVFAAPNTNTTGKIEDFVAKMRENGRTTGAVAFFWPTSSWGVTYNGKTLSACVSEGTIPDVNHYAYLTWDSSTIVWASSKPAELDNYVPLKSAYTFVPE